ncbi:sigma-70 region 4 domain-containing protein [Streptomyces sp. NPDC005500]|uniref:RNA polymerase sigma factor n=1 Tax=Streptomyces sp. NPDC005500 TaxID=3155007 RepID=UPI0033B309DF
MLARLATLPISQREVLELVAVDGLTVGEAATVLGINAVAARVRLHRARRAFKDAPASTAPDSAPPLSSLMEA